MFKPSATKSGRPYGVAYVSSLSLCTGGPLACGGGGGPVLLCHVMVTVGALTKRTCWWFETLWHVAIYFVELANNFRFCFLTKGSQKTIFRPREAESSVAFRSHVSLLQKIPNPKTLPTTRTSRSRDFSLTWRICFRGDSPSVWIKEGQTKVAGWNAWSPINSRIRAWIVHQMEFSVCFVSFGFSHAVYQHKETTFLNHEFASRTIKKFGERLNPYMMRVGPILLRRIFLSQQSTFICMDAIKLRPT